MNFDLFRDIVDNCANKQELSQKWLNKILREYFDFHLKGVQYERNTIGGRLDCRLIVNDRPKVLIELKKPTYKNEDLYKHFRQAHKYAHAMYVWRKGLLTPPLGLLTNLIFIYGSKPPPLAVVVENYLTNSENIK